MSVERCALYCLKQRKQKKERRKDNEMYCILAYRTVMEQVEEKEEMVVAFSWRIHDLPASLATLTEERPLTSGDMKSHE